MTKPVIQSVLLGGRFFSVSLILAVGLVDFAAAAVTNAIWQTKLKGTMVIQQFTSQVQPVTQQSKFKESDFLRMVLNQDPSRSEYLALNVDMAGGTTNFYLTVFDTSDRRNTLRLSVFETTTIISDGQDFVFTTEAPLVPSPPNWGGGFLRIAGRGRFVNGVPTGVRATFSGTVVDNRPGDLQGTTGLVVRANMSTSKAPLRILPPAP
jgi:hypothetical protein